MNAVEMDPRKSGTIQCLAGCLDGIVAEPLLPYSEEAISFLAALSSRLMKDRSAKGFPDIISFAYWCRKSNIERKRDESRSRTAYFDERIGRGLTFHIAPSNIPVNFAFSFAFGLLAGNACIVRVPSKPFEQTGVICRAIEDVLPEHPEIAKRCAVVTYPVDDEVTGAFSLVSDARLIWGGDSTIASVRRLPSKPRCVDILFSDRYSVALMDGRAMKDIGDEDLSRLAEGFYNDTYLMDQNACSSPQVIYWLHDVPESRDRFWAAVRESAARRYVLQPQIAMDKYVQLCEDVLDAVAGGEVRFDGLLTVVDVLSTPDDICGLRGKGGYFYQQVVSDLDEIEPFVTERFQTLLYFGIEASDIRDFVLKKKLRGIDRIVPVGHAMDIDIVWDGYDLVAELSRIVDVR